MFTRRLDDNELLELSPALTAAQLHFSRGWPTNFWFIETLLFLMALWRNRLSTLSCFSPGGKSESDQLTQCATTFATLFVLIGFSTLKSTSAPMATLLFSRSLEIDEKTSVIQIRK